MAYLEQFVQVESVLTYLFVGSGTFAFQITLSKPFSALTRVYDSLSRAICAGQKFPHVLLMYAAVLLPFKLLYLTRSPSFIKGVWLVSNTDLAGCAMLMYLFVH